MLLQTLWCAAHAEPWIQLVCYFTLIIEALFSCTIKPNYVSNVWFEKCLHEETSFLLQGVVDIKPNDVCKSIISNVL
jgi:hypothetical protein